MVFHTFIDGSPKIYSLLFLAVIARVEKTRKERGTDGVNEGVMAVGRSLFLNHLSETKNTYSNSHPSLKLPYISYLIDYPSTRMIIEYKTIHFINQIGKLLKHRYTSILQTDMLNRINVTMYEQGGLIYTVYRRVVRTTWCDWWWSGP